MGQEARVMNTCKCVVKTVDCGEGNEGDDTRGEERRQNRLLRYQPNIE